MIQKKPARNRGLIGWLILLVVSLVLLSYVGISLRSIVESPTGQSNFGYVKELTLNVWDNYLSRPATYLYNDIFLDLIWGPFVDGLQKMKRGETNVLSPPQLNLNTN